MLSDSGSGCPLFVNSLVLDILTKCKKTARWAPKNLQEQKIFFNQPVQTMSFSIAQVPYNALRRNNARCVLGAGRRRISVLHLKWFPQNWHTDHSTTHSKTAALRIIFH